MEEKLLSIFNTNLSYTVDYVQLLAN